MKKHLLFVGAMLAFWGLALGALHPAAGQMMGTIEGSDKFPIKVVSVQDGTAVVEPMLPVQFIGKIEGDVKSSEVLRCKSHGKVIGKLEGSGQTINMIELECEGQKRIVLSGVSFQ